ncbi:MAG: T9SS type A sorting domain-containing protein [bacterium]
MRGKRKHSYIALSGVLTVVSLFIMVSITLAQHETWITKSEMPTARFGASACLVDGKIYVLGGAGQDVNNPYGTIEVYDPGTNAWTAKTDMPIPNYFFSASLVNGKIYIIGGAEREWGFKASVEEYDPVSETWTSKKDMPTARSAHAARVVDGVIYVMGGSQGSTVLDLQTVEAYDPATDVWTQKANMPTGRTWLATSVVDGIIYAIGGTDAHFVALRAVEAYDPATDVWTSKAKMPTPRAFSAAVAVRGNIYVIGGTLASTLESLNTVEAYNPKTGVWKTKANMPTIRTAFSGIAMDDKIYAFGGTSNISSIGSVFTTVEEYNPDAAALPASQISHVSGAGGATVAALVDDSTQFTQNGYRITFNDTLFENTVYDVLNVGTGEKVIENAAHKLDGVTPGPLFNGLRLLIKDHNPAQVDQKNTGWQVGLSEWQAKIAVTDLTSGFEVIKGYAHPADYKITLFENIADTSVAMFGWPATPMSFHVWNMSENRKAPIVFAESDADQQISRFDRIIILEPKQDGELGVTWTILFSGSAGDAPPQIGDEFIFKTLKPVTTEDIYEFNTIVSAAESGGADLLPDEPILYMNYPNPFNPSTTITYDLPRTLQIEIAVYNVLGRRVVTLKNGKQQAGRHEVHWDGRDSHGILVGSGLYFSKLITENGSISHKMVLLK